MRYLQDCAYEYQIKSPYELLLVTKSLLEVTKSSEIVLPGILFPLHPVLLALGNTCVSRTKALSQDWSKTPRNARPRAKILQNPCKKHQWSSPLPPGMRYTCEMLFVRQESAEAFRTLRRKEKTISAAHCFCEKLPSSQGPLMFIHSV